MNSRDSKEIALNKEGLIEKIYQYERKRKEEFWGGLFGYSKCQKVTAAEALRNFINDSSQISNLLPHVGALNQGRLKTCWNLYIEMFPEQHKLIQTELENLNKNSNSPKK